MRLTKQTTYAVRALIYCAVNTGQLARVSEIADAFSMSEAFLFKLIKPLVDNGMLETVRGRNGGVRLARGASDITLYDVVSVTEDNFILSDCSHPGDCECPIRDECQFHNALAEALDAFFTVLKSYSIHDLAKDRESLGPKLGLAV